MCKRESFVKCFFIAILVLISSCSSMTLIERENRRNELDTMAEKAITSLIEQDASLQKQIDDSLAYGVANMKVTKVPIVGAGGGEGVFINIETKKRTYFTVSRFDIGGGWGARSYKALVIVNSQALIETSKEGTWLFQSGVEASAGTASAEGSAGDNDNGYSLHILSDGGASATATARVIRLKVNAELMEGVE